MVCRLAVPYVYITCRVGHTMDEKNAGTSNKTTNCDISHRKGRLHASLSLLLVNRQTRAEVKHFAYDNVICEFDASLVQAVRPRELFRIFSTTPHIKTKLWNTKHLVIHYDCLEALWELATSSWRFEINLDILTLLIGLDSIKVVVDDPHTRFCISRNWNLETLQHHVLTVGTKAHASFIDDTLFPCTGGGRSVLERLIEQEVFNQDISVMVEQQISSRKMLLMNVDSEYEMEIEVIWKKQAKGASVWPYRKHEAEDKRGI